MNRRQTSLLAAAWLVVFAGCGSSGPPLGRVSGTVTLDGKPLAGARIVFQPQEGGSPSTAMTQEDGRYELIYLRDYKGATIGKHTVTISTFRQLSGTEGSGRTEIPERVPARYNDATQLVRQVDPGSTTLDFELEGERNPGS